MFDLVFVPVGKGRCSAEVSVFIDGVRGKGFNLNW